ncbi:MAG TPA: hypothetical protein VHE55_16590 [Fimbriimonadaceae bacterium]|nr:hypothetical protein [Fimbriimonadaceae bacterium]
MRKLTIGAMVAAMALSAMAPAQDTTGTSMITSGPWMMRKTTGNQTEDRLWFIMDHTLNAAEMDTMKSALRAMPGSTSYVLMKAIVNAIDDSSKNSPTYSNYSTSDWMSSNGMSDMQVYDAMNRGLGWEERGVLHEWENHATSSQLMVVSKLVQRGGWANALWNQTSS